MATEYEGLDLEELKKEYNRVTAEPGANNNNVDYLEKFVRLPEREGFTLLRILPRKKGEKLFCATRIHTLVNPTTGKKSTFHCHRNLVSVNGKDTWKGECLICKVYSDTWNESNSLSGKAQEDRQNQARALKPVERYYYPVIVRSEKDKDGVIQKNVGPKIFSCGKTTHSKILRGIFGDDVAGEKPLGDVTHPESGRDFRVVKKVVKGGNGTEYPNYDNSKFDDVSSLGSAEDIAKWMESKPDLQALRALKSEDELRHALRVHLGIVKEGESQNDDLDVSEFRVQSNVQSQPQEKVREELVVTTSKPESKPSSNSDDEGILADADFMAELESM